jgi:MoxR-like ATPase
MRQPQELQADLEQHQYLLADDHAVTVSIALHLEKPLLVEGPAGVGKTELAKGLSQSLGAPLIRLQCYEGLGEEKALYEWNYAKQLLHIQADKEQGWDALSSDIFSADYLLERPLLKSIQNQTQTVLLVDELDRVDEEFEAFLLELLSDFQITIPELGTVSAEQKPIVVVTSNATRELSEALRRRCIYLYMEFPDLEREREIVRRKVPEIEAALAEQVVRTVQALRQRELKKPPSVSETLDWARALHALQVDALNHENFRQTATVLLKHRHDAERLPNLDELLKP